MQDDPIGEFRSRHGEAGPPQRVRAERMPGDGPAVAPEGIEWESRPRAGWEAFQVARLAAARRARAGDA